MRALAPRKIRKRGERKTLEADIEKYLTRQCVMRGWDAWKLTSPGRRGVPDRLILADEGVMCMVECKRPVGGKLSPLQGKTIAKLRDRRFEMIVVKNVEEVDKLISYLKSRVEEAKDKRERTEKRYNDLRT